MTALPLAGSGSGPHLDARGPMRAAALAALLLVGLGGGWAATTEISGAVIAHGRIIVEGRPKEVQSLDGGLVAEIHVAPGDIVAPGDLLLRLDATEPATALAAAEARLADALALAARLEAEAAGTLPDRFAWPDLPVPLPDMAEAEAEALAILRARRAAQEGARARLAAQEADYDAQLAALARQQEATAEEIALAEAEVTRLAGLAADGLARAGELAAAERLAAGLRAGAAALAADRARLVQARREAAAALAEAEARAAEEIVTLRRQAQAEIAALLPEILTRRAALGRIEIRAPAAGRVHELAVTTVGGVVAPGATLMQIVPQDGPLDIELRVDPRMIDEVAPGQPARLRIGVFDPQTTPELHAVVQSISADAVEDARSGQSFYRVMLALPPEERARLPQGDLLPGMPVDAWLETEGRTVLGYLLGPISAHLARAFRD